MHADNSGGRVDGHQRAVNRSARRSSLDHADVGERPYLLDGVDDLSELGAVQLNRLVDVPGERLLLVGVLPCCGVSQVQPHRIAGHKHLRESHQIGPTGTSLGNAIENHANSGGTIEIHGTCLDGGDSHS